MDYNRGFLTSIVSQWRLFSFFDVLSSIQMNELEHTSYEHTEGASRRPISNARLAVLVLLGAEIMFFAGLIGTFLVFSVWGVSHGPHLRRRMFACLLA